MSIGVNVNNNDISHSLPVIVCYLIPYPPLLAPPSNSSSAESLVWHEPMGGSVSDDSDEVIGQSSFGHILLPLHLTFYFTNDTQTKHVTAG